MVTRKSFPDNSPSNSDALPKIHIQDVRDAVWSPTDSDEDGEKVWGDAGSGRDQQSSGSSLQDVPAALRPGASGKSTFDQPEENPWDDAGKDTGAPREKPKVTLEHVPTVLRPGGRMETNPFKRKPVQNGPVSTHSTGTSVGRASGPPSAASSGLQLGEPDPVSNPWKPAIDEQKPGLAPPPVPTTTGQESGTEVWESESTSIHPSYGPITNSPALVSIPSGGESPAWDEGEPSQTSLPALPQKSSEEHEFSQDAHAWDDVGTRDKGKAPALPPIRAESGSGEGWNLVDHESEPTPASLSRQSTWENFIDGDGEPPKKDPPKLLPAAQTTTQQAPPELPPRTSVEQPPPQPPRPHTPSAATKSETYQIKNINWHDANAAHNARRSPILVQNANGPCPLVALVNALTLTTPADLTNTVLVETLRSREQISLNLLLEAVFDELMSPRRTRPDAALPDVTELYTFLKGLHTGMNVNPRYVPTPELITAHKRTSLTHVHPSERGDCIPGTFEDTRDMKLYATFSIPLIHGWLPPKDDPVYEAFERQATSYDEAQTLMFREEELEDRLSNSSTGLTEQEQQMYQDIITIKGWLNVSATQLTPWGLEVVTKAIQPGTFSIFFRNDHFSTLYRHPQTMQLLTLVTDAGYHTHDEVVWESLVDVNGERADFFSGDFRLVGGPQQQQQASEVPGAWYTDGESSNAQGSEWQAVPNRQSKNRNTEADAPSSPMSPNHEQEDRDLALALQLQEEEEERHRNEQAARRHETQLSEQFIEQQGRGSTARTGPRGRGSFSTTSSSTSRGGGNIAPSRVSSSQIHNVPIRPGQTTSNSNASRGRGQQVRPLVTPRVTTHRPNASEDDDAPPSYEQASKATPYVPPTGHPNHPESSPVGATGARRRPTLPTLSSTTAAGPSMPAGRGMRPPPVAANSGMGNAMPGAGRDKDCVVM
ncbi:hypothetical protein BJ170DRAFT_681747 [Xylariales sp. AK1849]|nr:hypothetical protein BJ170DRAFT_681747 [Xylariales sp. AK1849]